MTFYYFISKCSENSEEFSQNWFNRIPSTEEIIIPDRLYKTIDRAIIQCKKACFVMHIGQVDTELTKQKKYKVVSICSGIKFYFDDEYGFIESNSNQFDTVVEIFDKLISTEPERRIIFFINLCSTQSNQELIKSENVDKLI